MLFASARLRVGVLHVAHPSNVRPGLADDRVPSAGLPCRTQPPQGLLKLPWVAHVGLRSAALFSLPKEENTRLRREFSLRKHDSGLVDVPVCFWCLAARATARLAL